MSEQDDAPLPPDPETLERLREAFAAVPPGLEHGLNPEVDVEVDPEQVWSAVHGELDREATEALIDRLPSDPQLALEWRLALALAADEASPATVETAANDRRYWYAGLLGSVAAAALLLWFVIPDPVADERIEVVEDPRLRASTGEPELRASVPEGASLPRDRFELSWSAVAGASRYELRVVTLDLRPIHTEAELEGPQARVPAARLESLAPGTTLVWQVTAVFADGRRLESPAWQVRLE